MSDCSSSSSENSRRPLILRPPVDFLVRDPYFVQRVYDRTRNPPAVPQQEFPSEDSQSRGEETTRTDSSRSASEIARRARILMRDRLLIFFSKYDTTKRASDQTKKPPAVSPQESSPEISRENPIPADSSHEFLPKDSESRSAEEPATTPVPQETIDVSTSEVILLPPESQAQSQENLPDGFIGNPMTDHATDSAPSSFVELELTEIHPPSGELSQDMLPDGFAGTPVTDHVPASAASDFSATKKQKFICDPKNRQRQNKLQSVCRDSEKRPVVEREDAAVLSMVMDALRNSPFDLSRNDDFTFQFGGNCIPFLESTLTASAVSNFDEEEKQEEEHADSATMRYFDPAKISRPYNVKFCEQIFSRLDQIKKLRHDFPCRPLSTKNYRKTSKGYAQSDLQSFMLNGSCASTPYSRPLFKDLFSLQHSYCRFAKELKFPNDLHRVGDSICYGAGVDPLATYFAIHDPGAEHYQRHPKEMPNAAHFHFISPLNLSKSKRISNSFRHIGIRMTLCLLDAQCGNRFIIPHKPISDTAVMEGKYPIGYKGRRNFKNEEPAWYELFDEEYLKNMILPDDFILRYASPDGSPVFSTGIFGTWSPGIKTQKMKIEADLNAADRLLAARHQLTNLPTESLRLPQHLLRRIAALHMSEHLDINEQTQFMNQCVGDGATPETKAATFLHVSQALRQGMGESYRYRRYLTGDSM